MKVAVLGLGQRGYNYIRWIKYFCKDIEVNAICDINKIRTEQTAKAFKIKQKFYLADDFFKNGAIADAVIIATQDRDHYGHCIKAITAGYKHILVEKPVSPNIDECEQLNEIAKEKGVTIIVCHVLRYSKHYKTIKKLIDDNVIGDIITINHIENIAYFHYAHSYVRGSWRRSDETSPLILAKCCHDFDILYWLIKKPCLNVSSFGDLTFFKRQNAPEDSAERCLFCKVKDCQFNAEKLYIMDKFYKATFIKFSSRVFVGKANNTKAEKYEALKNGPYGRCVFKCDNNVVDHQIINMQFADGVTASHTVTAFSEKFYRRTQISGTKGEIIADDLSGKIKVNIYHKKSYTINTKLIKGTGHIDGDINLIKNWAKLLNATLTDYNNVTYLSDTLPSHRIALASEKSRLNKGKVINLK